MDLLVAVELLSSAIKGVAKLLDRFVEVVNALVGDPEFGKVCIEDLPASSISLKSFYGALKSLYFLFFLGEGLLL